MQLFLGHFLQSRPVDFSGGIERHLAEEDDFFGRFVPDALTAEID
jgi:hypothetical protein